MRVAVAGPGQAGDPHGPHPTGALPCRLARRPDHCHRRRWVFCIDAFSSLDSDTHDATISLTLTRRLLFPRCRDSGDETLRFWSVFPGAKAAGSAADDSSVSTMMRAHIR